MNKELLIRILTTSPRVVLPGFGAFLRNKLDGQIVFTPFLKTDDGFLVSQVAHEYEIDSSDAGEMVKAFVEHVKHQIDTKGKYFFEGVGTLEVDLNDSIAFVMDLSKQIPATAPSTPAPAPTPEPAPAPAPIPEPAPAPQPQTETPRHVFPPQGQQTKPLQPRTIAPQPIGVPRVQFTTPTPKPQPVPQPQVVRPTAPPVQRYSAPTQQPQTESPKPERPQQNTQRPAQQQKPRPKPHRSPAPPRKKQKGDAWLLIAVIAAVIVIGLMIFGILTANEVSSLE